MKNLRLLAALLRRSIAQSRYVLVPCLLLLVGFQLILVAQAVSIESSQSFERLAQLVPSFLTRGLGSSAALLATFKGIVAFGYFHPVVMLLVSVLAAYVASEPAADVESGLVDLVLARSIPRHLLITRSAALTLATVLAAAGAMAAGTSVGLRLFPSPGSDWPSPRLIGALLLHLVPVACVFGAFSLAVASGGRRWSTTFAAGAIAVVLMYLLFFLSLGWPAARPVGRLSPFYYFPALPLVGGEPTDPRNIAVLVVATAAFTAAAYWRFARRDL